MLEDKIGPELGITLRLTKISPVPTFVFNDDNECVHINDSAIKLLGYDICDLDKAFFTFVKEGEEHKVKASLEKKISNPFPLVIITKNGDEKNVDAMGVTVEYDDIKYRFSTVHDKTDIIEMNNNIIRNMDTLRMVSISDILLDISHQWRQPLSMATMQITGIAAKIECDMYDENTIKPIADDLYFIDKILQELSRTVDNFNNLSTSSGIKSRVLLSDIFNNSYDVLKNSINNMNITLKTSYSISNSILVYENDIKQVFTILLKNAEDAFIGKQIINPTICVELKESNESQIFTIRDNAGGIEKNIISRIFEPYFTTKHKKNGVGLALYQAKNIVEKLCKGTIKVENKEFGAMFTITIPREE